MGKIIKSPFIFKTCYIAVVKEELGLLKRETKSIRKLKPPVHLKWTIVEALRRKPYREIQKLAFKIFKEKQKTALPFYGVLGNVKTDLLEEVLNSKELSYED